MKTKDYEKWVTSGYPETGSRAFPELLRSVDGRLCHPVDLPLNAVGLVLGLCGEAGEVADAVKKIVRDRDCDEVSDKQREAIKLELGDVLWYLTGIADAFGWRLEDVMVANWEKIKARRAKR